MRRSASQSDASPTAVREACVAPAARGARTWALVMAIAVVISLLAVPVQAGFARAAPHAKRSTCRLRPHHKRRSKRCKHHRHAVSQTRRRVATPKAAPKPAATPEPTGGSPVDQPMAPAQTVLTSSCAPPAPPSTVPAGSGWLTGGVYTGGGPPGRQASGCGFAAYQIVLIAPGSGEVLVSQQVAAGHSYTIVAPAGTYALRAYYGPVGGMEYCPGKSASFTVTAGAGVEERAVCDVP